MKGITIPQFDKFESYGMFIPAEWINMKIKI